MAIQPNNPLPQTNDMARSPALSSTPPVSPTSVYPQVKTPKPRQGFPWGRLLVGLALIALVAGVVMLTNSPTNSSLKKLQSQVESLEQKAKTSSLSAEDLNTLDKLQQDVKNLETKTANLPENTKTELAGLIGRLDKLETTTGANGRDGANGANGTNGTNGTNGVDGATGATGPQGPSGIATCPNGTCLSLQVATPGVAETGSLNITGTAIASSFSGSGASLTTLNATNISSGTVADARLTTNVTLQGNSFNGVSQLVQLTAGGILPVLSGANLTNLTGANVSGNISGNAATATALAANPTDCGSNSYATTIAANGDLTCASITDASLSTNVTLQGNSFNGVSQLVQLTAGGLLPALSGVNLTNLNATNLASGTVADARLTTNVTLQGNAFNGVSQLVQLTAGGILPVLSGANLTALNATNLASGTVDTARISGSYTGITGTGALDAGSITSGFGAIDVGADNITTTGTLQGTTSVLTTLLDTASAVALNIGTTNASSINLKKSTEVTGNINFSGKLLEDGNEVFSGLISAFTTACPTGWTEYTGARGRYLVGTPSGGTDEATVGTALTNSENRATGVHSHGITDPGHTHAGWDTAGYALGGGALASYPTSAGTSVNPITQSATTGITVNNSTGVAGTNAPYIQVHYCQKTAGADLAEWTPTSENLSAGAIVSIDQHNDKKLVSSKRAYDETVAGVISTDPGWTLGQESEGQALLALAGRVPVQVSLVNGDIKKGDPITTSDIPGVGMKATKPGMIIGRAMEDLTASSSGLSDCIYTKCGKIVALLNVTRWEPDKSWLNISNATDVAFWAVVVPVILVKSARIISKKFKNRRS